MWEAPAVESRATSLIGIISADPCCIEIDYSSCSRSHSLPPHRSRWCSHISSSARILRGGFKEVEASQVGKSSVELIRFKPMLRLLAVVAAVNQVVMVFRMEESLISKDLH